MNNYNFFYVIIVKIPPNTNVCYPGLFVPIGDSIFMCKCPERVASYGYCS